MRVASGRWGMALVGDLSEEEMIRRLRAGDKATFSSLVRALHGGLVRLAEALVGPGAAAEALVRQTWMETLSSLGSHVPGLSFKGRVFRLLLAGAREREVEFGSSPAASIRVRHAVPDQPTESQSLIRAIEALPTDERIVVLLRDVEGLAFAEVACILEIDHPRLSALLHRARVRVRQQIYGPVHLQPALEGGDG